MKKICSTKFDFSHGVLFISDGALKALPYIMITMDHVWQGFTRTPSCIAFCLMEEFGTADLQVFLLGLNERLEDCTKQSDYERIISVPLTVSGSNVRIECVDDCETIELSPGFYVATVAQKVILREQDSEDFIALLKTDIYLSQTNTLSPTSKIVLADHKLAPQTPLLENADLPQA